VPYLPAAIVGNGELLATLSRRGELERIFWPHVDHGQHLGELRLGVVLNGDTHWLDEEPFDWEQGYAGSSSILRTVASDGERQIEITDLVRPADPVLVRRVRTASPGLGLVVCCRPELDEARFSTAAYLDPGTGALVFYRRETALAIALRPDGRGEVYSAADDLETGTPAGGTVAHRAPVEGALTVELHDEAHLFVAFGSTPGEALQRLERPLRMGFGELEEERRGHDARRLATASPAGDCEPQVERIYHRSLLTLELLSDRSTGGVIAAPELDPDFVHCGGYGFVWPRDLAYVVLGLLAGGCDDLALPALRWLARTQTPEGLWLQRHWTDGALAPSWSLHQIDETGATLFAYEAAWRELRDEELDRELWPSARRAGELLVAFLDDESGLPRASVDLWEQHEGQHSYSAAAVAAGLGAAADFAARHEPELEAGFRAAAARVRRAIEAHLWSEEHGRYLRSRFVGRRDDAGDAVPAAFTSGLRYPNRAVASVDPLDARVDSSLLGLAWPFRAVDPESPRMRSTVAAIERELLLPEGGVLRYEGDAYAGGNPWLLTTLWLGLYYRQVGDEAGLRRFVDYVTGCATPLGLLPEQVTRTGEPAWVLPLAWSHAMLLLAVRPELAIVADEREPASAGRA
jgi:oligosaccharide amylase